MDTKVLLCLISALKIVSGGATYYHQPTHMGRGMRGCLGGCMGGGMGGGMGSGMGGALDSATQFSSSVQKTFQKDVNVIKNPLYGGFGHPSFIGHLGSPHVFTQPAVVSTGPIEVHPRRGAGFPMVPVDRTLIGYQPGHGMVLPAEEESLHIYKEESESLSKRPLVGGGGMVSPIGVGVVEADNTEKLFRKSHVSRPVISGGVMGSIG